MKRRNFLKLIGGLPFCGFLKPKDTLESLAEEFGLKFDGYWDLDEYEESQGNMLSLVARFSDPNNEYRNICIWIYFLGREVPLREQFIVETAKCLPDRYYTKDERRNILHDRELAKWYQMNCEFLEEYKKLRKKYEIT